MYWLPAILLGLIVLALEVKFHRNWIRAIIIIVAGFLITLAIVAIDFHSQTTDTEVWSGSVVDWEHTEEWDEWHPPTTSCTTDSNNKQTCKTDPGYWEHHYATNSIKTSDEGWISVDQTPKGKTFDDEWPNDDKVLKKHWPKGMPTASSHAYVNKVNASYSIYKHENVDLVNYPDLPSYPDKVRDDFHVDRIIGEIPNKKEALNKLAAHNTRLNAMVPDTESEEAGKMKSWKQVNIIFVNVGENKTEDYGFALQDSWEGGNKNDFVVSFSMNKDGKLNWVYPFSWSEVEILKFEVRDYIMNLQTITDFAPVVDEVAAMVENKFERKQFADFDYLQINLSSGANLMIWILNLIALVVNIFLLIQHDKLFGYRHSHLRRW